MRFDSFVGNRKIIERLRTKLREARFPHGVIFSGPEGVGKHTCAVMIAKALNCLKAEPSDFCDECNSCRKINAGTHPDVMTITVEEDSTQIKIAQVRQILASLYLQPLEGRNKVFIIDPADLLNADAANALLKGLEEPPPNSFFFLITINVLELLLTVRSRCQVYNFTPLKLDEIRQNGITDELKVRWSQGSIGRARSLDVAHLKSEREILMSFLQTVVTAPQDGFQDLLNASAEIGRAKLEFQSRMDILAVLLADILYVKEGAHEKLVNVDIQPELTALAERAPVDRLLQICEFLRFIESSLKIHVNRQMLTDLLAISGNPTAGAL